jgi:thiamine-monophosphate kinase
MPDNKHQLTPLSQLGEFGLINHLTKDIVPMHPGTIKGIGDDAAVLDYRGKQLAVTTDLLTEGIHFNLIYTPLKHLGYKAVVVNISDLCAMQAQPRQVLVSLAVSAKFAVEHLEELYSGIYLACEKYGVDLVGGDTSSSLTGLTISITAIGELAPGKAVYRSGAKPNDLVCVTGDLGAAFLGLQILEREKKVFMDQKGAQPDLGNYSYVLERQLKPEARQDIIRKFNELNIHPTSMIDISDGLSSEMIHLCTQSNTGCAIYQDKIPVAEETASVAAELNLEPVTCALNGGEDYELLFTVPLSEIDKIRDFPGITMIGHMTAKEEGMHLITAAGEALQLRAQGWSAYARGSGE